MPIVTAVGIWICRIRNTHTILAGSPEIVNVFQLSGPSDLHTRASAHTRVSGFCHFNGLAARINKSRTFLKMPNIDRSVCVCVCVSYVNTCTWTT